MIVHWLLVPAAYCLGSISFSLLLVRRLRHYDLRNTGSGNLGATNVLRSAGTLPALAVLVLDVAKGAVPIQLGERIGASGLVMGATAVAVVAGHVFPLFHGFRGGKGVATTAGALGAAQPQILLVSAVAFLIALLLTRYVSVASMLGVALYPITAVTWVAVGRQPSLEMWVPLSSALIAVLVIWCHRTNIRRLLKRREARFGSHREVG